jgi:dipeptidyl aminopeptidase/acylaminoacyl peptidase
MDGLFMKIFIIKYGMLVMVRFLFLLVLIAPLHVRSDELTYRNFGQLPDVASVTLSPTGKKLAAVIRVSAAETTGSAVQVTNLSSGKKNIVLFTDNSKYFLNSVRWKDDKTLLVSTYYPAKRDTWGGMRQIRYKTREGRLLIVDTDTGDVRSPFKKAFLRQFRVLPSWLSSVVDPLPNDPDHILMALPSTRGGGPYNVVYKVNITNQSAQIVQNPESNVQGWGTDVQHRIRIAHHVNDEMVTVKAKQLDTGEWRDLGTYEIFSEDEVNPLGFDYDPNVLYFQAYHNGYKAVFKTNLNEPTLKRELVYADPEFDVNGALVYDHRRERVIGVGGSQDGGTVFIDPTMQSVQAAIDKALPNRRNFVYSITNDLSQFLVYSTGHTESGTYLLGKLDPLSIEAVAYRYGALVPERLAPVTEYRYEARDGLEIQAWLTKPRNSKGKLPTIMFPHGGPHSRDSAAFDYWAQFFASKGYAVLQMNFRGSYGHGHAFFSAGLKNWGKEMQDDIQDGALALIKDEIADPERICIAGASYGGYAALMGVVKTPDFYQCAISVAGVSNVFDLVRDNRAFWKSYNVVDEQIGKLGNQLKEISPVNYADKIKVPVLLIHGDNDRQVEPKHSLNMFQALEKNDKVVEYIELEAEDHYLSNEKNRLLTFEAMDKFLDVHLPVNK